MQKQTNIEKYVFVDVHIWVRRFLWIDPDYDQWYLNTWIKGDQKYQ